MPAKNAAQWLEPPRVPETHYVSGAVYTDPAIFAEEREKIFFRTWRMACHESELPAPGDFRTYDHVGMPLVTVRGKDGRIRTFLNVCSHRGATLVQEIAGNVERFVCFYHLWAYDTAGTCIDIPREDGYAKTGLRKEDCGLREVRTETRLGLVFINMDDAAEPLADFLGPALDRFENVMSHGNLEVLHYSRQVLKANWKAWMETNVDAYHTFMHVGLRKTQVDTTRRITVYPNGHTGGGGQKMTYANYAGWANRDQSLALPGLDATEMRTVHLWPNALVLSRGTIIRLDTIVPIDIEHTVVEFRGLGMKGDTPEQRRQRNSHHNQFWGPLGRNIPEDAFAAEACAMTFGPGAARYQTIARQENLTAQDDAGLRNFYGEWSRRLGRPYHNPSNRT
ncbi:MAG: aromatic ring-hydroxylating dioxygenase subunit alpha [Alphaproteobacteria bacterium]|nr:aromatic ring-hydroxylating dioxygenase subunit alpha [Alphaproteobacteria bacterium]